VWSTDLEHVEIYSINIAIRVKSVDFHASFFFLFLFFFFSFGKFICKRVHINKQLLGYSVEHDR
jgi:hypothetical protein